VKDWRKEHIKDTWFQVKLHAILFLVSCLSLLIFVAFIISRYHNNETEDYSGILAFVVASISILATGYAVNKQDHTAVKLSVLESEIQNYEKSLDKFYLPLMALIQSQKDGIIEFSKLEQLKGYRYLAKPKMLNEFQGFLKEHAETKKTSVTKLNSLLDIAKHYIDSINDDLIEFYEKKQ
jgi:hypothetical protein